jgi:acyl-ACP thioesterase
MPAELPPPTEFVDPVSGARQFSLELRPGLGDCAPSGRLRLDALARWLQDVAYADVEDAGVAALAVWVVRRGRVLVRRWPRFAERHTVTTFCSGLGRMWAERRTTVRPAGDPDGPPVIDAVSLWVHLDPETRTPSVFTDRERDLYGAQAGERQIRARLRHAPPPSGARSHPWHFRAVDLDIAGHVNNAAYWQPLEEELLEGGEEPDGFDAEIEFRAGAQPGEHRILAAGPMRWILGDGEEVAASLAIYDGLPGATTA